MNLILCLTLLILATKTITVSSAKPKQNQTTAEDFSIPDDYPPVVSVSHCKDDPPVGAKPDCQHLCTGIILTRQWVLTVATCGIDDDIKKFHIRVKDPVRFPSGGYVYFPVRKQAFHEDFIRRPLEFNLQVMLVVGEFNRDQFARIPLNPKLVDIGTSPTDRMRQRSLLSTPPENEQVAVVGWGFTKSGSKMDFKKGTKGLGRLKGIVQPDACWFDMSDEIEDYVAKFANRICVDFSPATGPCSGHYGAPLVQGKGERTALVGILAFYDDPEGCYRSSAALFDLVENHQRWIERATKSRLFRITNGSNRGPEIGFVLMSFLFLATGGHIIACVYTFD